MVAPRVAGTEWDALSWHYRFMRDAAWFWHHPFVTVRVRGLDRLPLEGGYLLASNHTSWWDPIILMGCSRRPVHWLAKKSAMSNAFTRWLLGGAGCIPVDRAAANNSEAIATALTRLRDGRIIGIFPEGTCHRDGRLLPPKSGVGRLALGAHVPVVPVGIATDRFWPCGQTFPRVSEPIYVEVGGPVTFTGDPQDRKDVRGVADAVMERVARHMHAARAARDEARDWFRLDRAAKVTLPD